MQETHFLIDPIPRLPKFPLNQWFHAPSPVARARGVTIAIGKMCPMASVEVQVDIEGRYLFVKGILHGKKYTFTSMYAPNTCAVDFIAKTLRLNTFGEGFIV